MSQYPEEQRDDEGEPSSRSARFEVLDCLGEGGMAVVHVARDRQTGQRLAVKRLRPMADEGRAAIARGLMQREYHVLSQLAHPRVIQVYDYGTDDEGVFYTMELLDGADLHALTPLPWRRACALMRDVCSVLALLHSRQLVHRDISPRNVRVTGAGQAKLIDFGAMTPMGASREIVGTPALCAPEVVRGERLDARSDLFSVGCTLYYALVGSHAYPARDFSHLPLVWRQSPRRPSHVAKDVPKALDALVMSLLSLEADARPGSAAEVMERLAAVAELPNDESLPVPQAYLTTPSLVGRTHLMERVQKKLDRAHSRQRGTSLLLVGEAGTGRSRMLDAIVLQERFRGLEVLRADPADSQQGEGGVVRALAEQLLRQQPVLACKLVAPHRAVLGHLVPELVDSPDSPPLAAFSSPEQRRSQLQQALLDWFGAVSRECALAIGVDDLDRISEVDDLSCAFLALLAHQVWSHRVELIATVDEAALKDLDGRSLGVHVQASERLPLGNLRAAEVEDLLRSIFGDAKNLKVWAERLQAISEGNPRDVMELARHLVSRGVLRYMAGDWWLPENVEAHELPRSLADALRRKLGELDDESLQLARAFALAPDLLLVPESAATITSHGDPARAMASLNRLLSEGILRPVGFTFELSQAGWALALLEGIDEPSQASLLVRVAAAFLEEDEPFRAAQCLFQGGEPDRALDVLIEFSRQSVQETDGDAQAFADLLRSLPKNWAETYAHGVRLCHARGRSVRDLFILNTRAAGIGAMLGGDGTSAIALAELLTQATGLARYAELDATLDPTQRMNEAMRLAGERNGRLEERARLPAPQDALADLARAYMTGVGTMTIRLDPDIWPQLPDLAPLVPFAPVFGMVRMVGQGSNDRITGATHRARQIYSELLHRAEQADRTTRESTHHKTMVMRVKVALGFLEGAVGSVAALSMADEIAADPICGVDALAICRLYHLWQGDGAEADRLRTQLELDRIRHGTRGALVRSQAVNELSVFSATDDLLQLKQALPLIAQAARDVPSWVAIEHYARGEYHRIRGSHRTALSELHLASGLVLAGRHPLFCEVQAAYVRALVQAGRLDEARVHGELCLEEARVADLDHTVAWLQLELASVYAHVDAFEEADQLALRATERLESVGAGRLLRGWAEETRARIAMLAGNRDAFDAHRQRCADNYLAHGNRLLLAKYERLLDDAQDCGLEVEGRCSLVSQTPEPIAVDISQLLSSCDTPAARAKRVLSLMCELMGARGACLFAVEREGPVVVAEQGVVPDADQLRPWVRSMLARACNDDETTETGDLESSDVGSSPPPTCITLAKDQTVHSALVAHVERGQFLVTGLAVFLLHRDRPFVGPTELAVKLSRYWLASGEATAVVPGSEWLTSAASAG